MSVSTEAVRAQLIAQFFRLLPWAMSTALVLAFATVALLWPRLETSAALAWLAALIVSKLWRTVAWRRFQTIDPQDTAAVLTFVPALRIGCLLAGSVWGSAFVLLYPEDDPVTQMLLLLMLAGVSAGAVNSMATDRIAAFLFHTPMVLSVVAQCALEADSVHLTMLGMASLYAVFVGGAVQRLYRQDLDGTALRLIASKREDELRDSELRYRHLAHTDPMTDLPNRASLALQLPQLLRDAEQRSQRVALLYIDIDNFKDINDSHGHAFGDRYLTDFAQRLRLNVRPEDLIVRMGGDEFVVALSGAGVADDIELVAERLLQCLAAPGDAGPEAVHGTVSIGVAVFPEHGTNVEDLLINADIALYQAKGRGRGQCAFYSAGMSASFNERRTLERSLRHALGSNQLFVEYQPIVRIDNQIPVSLEALVRWRHPERGLLPPGVFIPIAERCGMEDLLGEHVLRAVCRQLRQWLDDMVPVVPVAVNVSPRQFERGRLIEAIARITREFAIDPGLLTIELTESALMQHAYQNLRTLNELRELGVRVAIDDFGTGYSSLSYLKNLPIDAIKIDRNFINDISRDPRDSNIIRAIVAIGASLALRVIAEGVETEEQSETLRKLGCSIAQGYLYHRPMPAADCTALLQQIPQQASTSDTIPTRQLHLSDELSTG